MRWMVLVALGLWACDEEKAGADGAPTVDAGRADGARPLDAGGPDGRVADAAVADAGPDAAVVVDAARVDAARPMDAAAVDARPADAGAPDAALPDAAPVDLGPPREIACFNGVDDDGDGPIDCADPDCRSSSSCFETPEDCGNGVDDNGDERVDCDDVLCLAVCPPAEGPLDVEAIQAIFDDACVVCHNPVDQIALLDLTAPFVAQTVGVASSEVPGLRIQPGSRVDSYLYRKLAFAFRDVPGGGGEGMPPWPEVPLPAATVDRIGQWIDALPPL